MAEECAYYYYESGYCCALKRETEWSASIDHDTAERYCWGYHYSECPRYKAKHSSGGGCFLTSACVEAKGLADDCRELTVLRNFRDTYMKSTDAGCADICEYYHTAPIIVEKIKQLPNAMEIFECIYHELVVPCVELIDKNQKEKAYTQYKNYVKKLQSQYC